MCEEEKKIVGSFNADDYNWGHPLAEEVYLSIRGIRDPEKPYTLEQLQVVSPENVTVYCNSETKEPEIVNVDLLPTNPGCSLATLIGLCVMYKMMKDIPQNYGFPKFRIDIKEGSHDNGPAIAKQLNDKERRYAALENPDILRAVMQSCKLEGEEDDFDAGAM